MKRSSFVVVVVFVVCGAVGAVSGSVDARLKALEGTFGAELRGLEEEVRSFQKSLSEHIQQGEEEQNVQKVDNRVVFKDEQSKVVFYDTFYRETMRDYFFIGPSDKEAPLYNAQAMERSTYALRLSKTLKVSCQTGYDKQKAVVFAVHCPLGPHSYQTPSEVQLEVTTDGKKRHLIVPIQSRVSARSKHALAVHTMVKGKTFPRLMQGQEWLSYCQWLGIQHFYIYVDIDPASDDTTTIMSNAEAAVGAFKNMVTLVPWNQPREGRTWFRARQLSAMNHCLNRYGHVEVDWLAFFDIDEYPLPLSYSGGKQPLMERLRRVSTAYAAVSLECTFFSPKLAPKPVQRSQGSPRSVLYRLDAIKNRNKLVVRPAAIAYMSDPHHLSLTTEKTLDLDPRQDWRLNHYWWSRDPRQVAGKRRRGEHVQAVRDDSIVALVDAAVKRGEEKRL